MHTYIETVKNESGFRDTINVNEFSDGTADVWICRDATKTWKCIGTYPDVRKANVPVAFVTGMF